MNRLNEIENVCDSASVSVQNKYLFLKKFRRVVTRSCPVATIQLDMTWNAKVEHVNWCVEFCHDVRCRDIEISTVQRGLHKRRC